MNFIKGRNNLAVTVYVPYDCPNNCKFCTSKNEYSKKTNLEKIKQHLHQVRNSSIKEVVFTGGEPMANCNILAELINIVDNKDVYINTSFIHPSIDLFLYLVNSTDCIKGINISRHAESFEQEKLSLIARDLFIKMINKPVKVNVVIGGNTNKSFFKDVLKRWGYYDVKVSFRADFSKTSPEKLHDLNDPILKKLLSFGEYVNRKYCDVCDTTLMKRENQYYEYHKGLETTSIEMGNSIIVNDVIIFPDGELCYDWDRKSKSIVIMKEQFELNRTEPVMTCACITDDDCSCGSCYGDIFKECESCGSKISYGSCGSGGC